MIRMLVFGCTDAERPIFEKNAARYGVDLTLRNEKITEELAHCAEGMDCINVQSSPILTDSMYETFRACGVRLAVSRTIGYEHMNLPAAKKTGIAVCNITYSPSSVADYAIMLMLMTTRKIKPMVRRYIAQDYRMDGLLGRELPNLTVGIAGYGRIGQTVARHLSGFGCRVLAWNRTPREDGSAQFVDLDTLLRESDILTLHLALNRETHHFIDADRIAQMKDGAILINTARGGLVDTPALIEALESGKLGAAGLDMFEGDRDIYYRNYENRLVVQHDKAILDSLPNAVMLPHAAYYTDQAEEDIINNSLEGARRFFAGEENPFRIL